VLGLFVIWFFLQ